MNTKERKQEKARAKKLSLDQTKEIIQGGKDKFWCNRRDQFIHVPVCVHRQKMEVEGCVSCAQGSVIKQEFEVKGDSDDCDK